MFLSRLFKESHRFVYIVFVGMQLDRSWNELQGWIERFIQDDVSPQTRIYVDRVLRKTNYELENIWYQTKIQPWLIDYYQQYLLGFIAQLTVYWLFISTWKPHLLLTYPL